jgi:hypothetical protein
MVATFTPNLQLTLPARGDDVGTWDTPVNSNETLIDLVAGGIATIALNNSNVVLSAAQFQSRNITFSSTLTGSVTVTFATSFTKNYEIQNLCTGSSAFTITLETTATGGQVVAVPPGVTVDVFNDGANIKFKNFWGPIGSYFDLAGSSSPNWNDACTVSPLLPCTGGSFSSASYPVLTTILGGTTLPNFSGRAPYYYNSGSTILSSNGAGIAGGTLFAAGGANGVTLTTANLPAYTPVGSVAVSGTVAVTAAQGFATSGTFQGLVPPGEANIGPSTFSLSATGSFTGSAQGGFSATVANAAPGIVSGLRMIRAG